MAERFSSKSTAISLSLMMIMVEPNTSTELIGPSFVVISCVYITSELTYHRVPCAWPNEAPPAPLANQAGFL